MTASVSQTPDAQRVEAVRKLQERDNLTVARGIKEGRRLERIEADKATDLLKAEHKGALETQLAGFEREEAKHVKAGYWKGFAMGSVLVGALVGGGLALYAAAIINPAFDAAARMQMQQSIVDDVRTAGQRSLPDRN